MSVGHRGLRLHLIGLLQACGSSAEAFPDLLVPRSIDQMSCLLEHRLRLEIAVRVDFASSHSGQRDENRFGIELSAWEGKLRVVVQALGLIILPAFPRLEAAVVETCEERSWIHGRDLDAELLEFKTHGFRDRLHRMLRG